MRPALSAMDPSHDTAVLLTPPGPAAIAVVRLAGPGVGPFLARQFSGPTPDGRCVHGMLRDEAGNVVDDPVVVCSSGGAVADLNVHGGAWVVESVLAMASRNGFARADAARDPIAPEDPAETQLEREALAHLPLARTELALRTLLAQPAAWAGLAASGQPLAKGELERVLADRSLQHLLALPRVAIVGAPNVGKSTLANQLFGTERSITADLPGTTRDWVGEVANVDGLAVMLVDTPGVRETADPIERGAIERGGAEVRRANLVVLVLDATRPLRPEQEPLLRAYGENALRVINKVDGPAAWDAGAITAIRTVASTGEGVAQVRDAIRERFGCLDVPPERVRVWTARQRAIVERAIADPTALRELL